MTIDWSKGKTRKQPFELFVMCKIAAGNGGNQQINEATLLKLIAEEYGCSVEPAHRKLMEFLNTPPYNRYYGLEWRGHRRKVVYTIQNPKDVLERELKRKFPRLY